MLDTVGKAEVRGRCFAPHHIDSVNNTQDVLGADVTEDFGELRVYQSGRSPHTGFSTDQQVCGLS